MKRPAVFFDRDNTLIASDGYLGDPSKVVLIEGAASAIARARKLGFAVVVFSNQSGVARGMFSEEDVQAVNTRMEELLTAEDPGAIIDRHEFCPFHPGGTIDIYARESDRRKPKPGMILSAAKALALDLSRSWVIGDAARDIEAGQAAGCRTILFADPSLKKSPAAQEQPQSRPDHTCATLAQAIDFVQRNMQNQPEESDQPEVAGSIGIDPGERAALMEPPAEPPLHIAAENQEREAPPIRGVRLEEPEDQSSHEAPPAKRIPKVAIGSRYVPPEGTEASQRKSAIRREVLLARQQPETTEANGEEPPTPKHSLRDAQEIPQASPDEPAPARVESLLEQIFLELRRQHEQRDQDFSVSKLLAGVVQVITLAVLFLAYLKGRGDPTTLHTYLLVAIAMQTLTIALLIMTRQR